MHTSARIGLALLLGVLAVAVGGITNAANAKGKCPPGQTYSAEITDNDGFAIVGMKCIPASRIPGDAVFTYDYEALCQPNVPDVCAPRPCEAAEQPARWFLVSRTHNVTGVVEELGGGCYSTADDPPEITPGLVAEALEEVTIPSAGVLVQPPGGRTLVNLKTIVSADAAPYEIDITVLDQPVHVWLRPVSWTWDFGDGSDPLVRADNGRPWSSGVAASQVSADRFAFHEYAEADDAVTVRLTVTWEADFRAPGRQPQPVPGSLGVASPGIELDVLEAAPQLVLP